MKSIALIGIGLVLAGAMSANAALYGITFAGSSGTTVAIGQIDVVGGLAVNGSLTVLTPVNGGTFNLLPGGPGAFLSPSGAFSVDNVVTPAANPFLDISGLLFAGNSSPHGYTEYNLWANGGSSPTAYTLYGWTAATSYLPQEIGEAYIAPVPEPTTVVAGIAALVLTLGGARRSSCKRLGR